MCKRHIAVATLAVIIGLAGLLAAQARPVLAQEPEPYSGVDFVFLIDQSGSMCGEACAAATQTRNDPQGFRFEGPKFAIIDFLGDQMSEIYVDSTARISIVEFGQDIDVNQYRPGENIEYENVAINDVLPMTTLEQDRDAWRIQREQLLQRMTDYQAERETRNLGNTDHLGAVRRAIEVLEEMQASDPSRRHKVIVLLTDGQSAICYPKGPADNPWVDQSCFGPGDILSQVESEIDANLTGEDYHFYVVGMADERSDYWTNNGPFWESLAARHNGEARLVESENEVAQFMGEIVNSVLSEFSLPADGPGVFTEWLPQLGYFAVRPYLQSLTFYIIRTSPTDIVNIYDPRGVALDLNLADGECKNGLCFYQLGRLIDKVVVSRPEPGTWRAEANIPTTENVYDTVRIGTRSLLFAPQLVKPTGGRYPEGVPLDVQIAMLDLDGRPVPSYEDNLFALNPMASVVANGQQTVAETSLDPETFSGEVVITEPGDAFRIHLVGTSHTPDGEEFQVLDHDLESGFSIVRLTGEFVPPEEPLQGREAPLSYQVDLGTFHSLPDGYQYSGQFELNHPELAAPVIIDANDEDGDGIFTAMYRPEANGTFDLDFELYATDEETGQQVPVPVNVKPDSAQTFDVGATRGLELVLTEPTDGSQQVKRNWLLQLVPMDIKVALVEQGSGQPVNWADVLASQGESVLKFEIQDPQGGSKEVELQPIDGEPGKFRFVGDRLAQSGEWIIELPQELELKDEFTLVNASPSATITRVENYPAFALWGGVILGLLVLVVWRVNHHRVKHSGPHLVGHLEILDDNDIPLAGGIRSFPAGVNQHTFSDLPSATGIKKLQVRYVSDDAVVVTVDGVPTTIMHETEWDSGRDFKIKYVNPTLE